jgi:hypothetical protein
VQRGDSGSVMSGCSFNPSYQGLWIRTRQIPSAPTGSAVSQPKHRWSMPSTEASLPGHTIQHIEQHDCRVSIAQGALVLYGTLGGLMSSSCGSIRPLSCSFWELKLPGFRQWDQMRLKRAPTPDPDREVKRSVPDLNHDQYQYDEQEDGLWITGWYGLAEALRSSSGDR